MAHAGHLFALGRYIEDRAVRGGKGRVRGPAFVDLASRHCLHREALTWYPQTDLHLSPSLPLSGSLSLSLALPPPPPSLSLSLALSLPHSSCLSVCLPPPPFLSTTYSIHLPHYLLPSLPTFTILLPLHPVLVLFPPPPPTPTPSSSLPPSPFSFTLLTYHHQQIPTTFTFHVRHHFLSLFTSVCFPPPPPPPFFF